MEAGHGIDDQTGPDTGLVADVGTARERPEGGIARVRHRPCIGGMSRAEADRLTHVVGLYGDPTTQAVVLSIDEKSQIQALDRTQPGLPLKPGRCGTMTHDYKRHGTTRCSRRSTCLTAR